MNYIAPVGIGFGENYPIT